MESTRFEAYFCLSLFTLVVYILISAVTRKPGTSALFLLIAGMAGVFIFLVNMMKKNSQQSQRIAQGNLHRIENASVQTTDSHTVPNDHNPFHERPPSYRMSWRSAFLKKQKNNLDFQHSLHPVDPYNNPFHTSSAPIVHSSYQSVTIHCPTFTNQSSSPADGVYSITSAENKSVNDCTLPTYEEALKSKPGG